jgi:hypothetical protein
MKGLFPVRPLNSLTNSLKFIIQPHDLETSDSLCGIGFQPIPAIPQLVYRLVPNTQVADVFFKGYCWFEKAFLRESAISFTGFLSEVNPPLHPKKPGFWDGQYRRSRRIAAPVSQLERNC